MRYFLFIFSVLLITSCSTETSQCTELNTENIELKENARILKLENDSLKNELYVRMQEPVKKRSKKNMITPAIVRQTPIIKSGRSYSSQLSNGSQCHAMTKKGSQCSRSARSGGYCWQHGG